jgi:hypothetical protein
MVAQLPGAEPRPDVKKTYTIATTQYAASSLRDRLGRIEDRRRGAMLRDLTVAHLKHNPFTKT